MAFSFGFSGDDIDSENPEHSISKNDAGTTVLSSSSSSSVSAVTAFPVPGKPLLAATRHELSSLMFSLPSKIAYSLLDIDLGDGSHIQLPRRELWDVRLQLMAEDNELRPPGEEHVLEGGLGSHDVKTGVYEGGFKSWESSVDLVKVIAVEEHLSTREHAPMRVIELGCGTALPSLAIFQWVTNLNSKDQRRKTPCSFVLADYNPSVLQLVTLPNFILAWAIQHQQTSALVDAFAMEGELELSVEVTNAFQKYLLDSNVALSFISGAWSVEFIQHLYDIPAFAFENASAFTLLLGAETIYSPFALQAFVEVLFSILEREQASCAVAKAFIAAKKLYFGVGGSLDDFIDKAKGKGAIVSQVCEETEGVRRGVVCCVLPSSSMEDAHAKPAS